MEKNQRIAEINKELNNQKVISAGRVIKLLQELKKLGYYH